MGTVTYQPKVRFRVLATHWEAESFTECWTETEVSATAIAGLLRSCEKHADTSVQIDRVISDQGR